ncbi:MAG: hypothetical protein JO051_08920 [Acidobacteriaceae bacterium]|nr:hypothetical protein [Acidobacteriaceae bacterium]
MTSNETEAEYAFWSAPDQPFTITYSLEQFHEIDFEVNEGYRRIPHGGIEIGGLLFGVAEESGVRIQAFRLIECEHATGPSFNLSDRDLERLQRQMDGSTSEPDLAGLQVIGWFVAHTRTPLRLSDREAAIVDRFFPKRHQITVLVKPERFQPTRFAFFARKADGSIERDGTAKAVILPLPVRGSRGAEGPVPSIAAPPASAAPPPETPAPPQKAASSPASIAVERPVPPPPPPVVPEHPALPVRPAPPQTQAPPPRARHEITRLRKQPEDMETVTAETFSPDQTRPDILRTDVRSPHPPAAPEHPDRPPGPWPRPHSSAGEAPVIPAETGDAQEVKSLTTVAKQSRLPAIDDLQRRRSERSANERASAFDDKTRFSVGLALLLLFAAGLGCGAGYWAYQQLPPPVVSLTVHPDGAGLVITWPTDQTRQAQYAAIRVNDGAQQPLSDEEKSAGAARISAPALSNVKVELIVQHWMRDSRGIVRYVTAVPAQVSQADRQPSH